jgi:hypothetical protein
MVCVGILSAFVKLFKVETCEHCVKLLNVPHTCLGSIDR